MTEISPIPNALKVTARAPRAKLRLTTSGDLRFANARGPWKIEGAGAVEIVGQQSTIVAISLCENRANEDTILGSFQPAFESNPSQLNLLLSSLQWQTMLDAMHGGQEFNLLIDAIVSLDVQVADYSETFGGDVMCFNLALVPSQ